MKLVKLAAIAAFTFNSLAVVAIEDNNPFAEDYEQNRNTQTEPKGVSVYSFKENSNRVTQIEPEKAYLQEAQHTKSYGYAVVSKGRVQDYNTLISGYQKQDELNQRRVDKLIAQQNKNSHQIGESVKRADIYHSYTFKKAQLSKNMNGTSKLILETPSGNFIRGKGWDAVTRIYSNSELGNVIVNEWHHAASQGGVIMDKDAINFYVNGNPAILIIRDSDARKAETVLSWADKQKSYTIQFDKNASILGLTEQLTQFAESISRPFIPMSRLDH